MAKRIREQDISLPALRLLAASPAGSMPTSALIAKLSRIFKPSGLDAAILAGRSDTRFSQIVRNLKSHRGSAGNIVNAGYARPVPGGLAITRAGRAYVAGQRWGGGGGGCG